MKTFLLPENGRFYKANLHTHSTVSDGEMAPKDLAEAYYRQGYSILAITDHELLVDHSDLNRPDFLTLTSYEYAITAPGDEYAHRPTVEFNLFAKDAHNETQVCFEEAYSALPHYKEAWRAKTVKYVGEPYARQFTLESMQHVIDEANAHGFLVSLNHPGYSMIAPDFFGQLHGLFAMEIYNHISFCCGIMDYSPQMFEYLLRQGKRLYCIAADDCHRKIDVRDRFCQAFGGWVMVRAESLTYENVIRALENGDFYASTGPEITSLFIEDGKVHITTSPCRHIMMNGCFRNNAHAAAEPGETITEAVFDLPKNDPFVRFTVLDAQGRAAHTRAYEVG